MKKPTDKSKKIEKIPNELFFSVPFFQVRFPLKNNWVYYLALGIIIIVLINFIILTWLIILIGFSP